MKIKVFGSLQNITDSEVLKIDTNAIKTKNKLTYSQNNEIYTLKILSTNKVILQRNAPEIASAMTFELGKTTTSLYNIKESNITLEINIQTKYLEVLENKIEIHYLVIDSNTEYQYKIEMSE